MIFKQIDEILAGKKTQTRRVVGEREFYQYQEVMAEPKQDGARFYRRWRVGGEYAIVPKRGAKGIGRYIRITSIGYEPLQNITEADAQAEGVESVAAYKELWERINGKTKGARWQDNPRVWVITFELAKEGG